VTTAETCRKKSSGKVSQPLYEKDRCWHWEKIDLTRSEAVVNFPEAKVHTDVSSFCFWGETGIPLSGAEEMQ